MNCLASVLFEFNRGFGCLLANAQNVVYDLTMRENVVEAAIAGMKAGPGYKRFGID